MAPSFRRSLPGDSSPVYMLFFQYGSVCSDAIFHSHACLSLPALGYYTPLCKHDEQYYVRESKTLIRYASLCALELYFWYISALLAEEAETSGSDNAHSDVGYLQTAGSGHIQGTGISNHCSMYIHALGEGCYGL